MPADKHRRLARFDGGLRIGDPTNNVEWDTAGVPTTTGTGRVFKEIWVGAADFFYDSGSQAGGGQLFAAGSMQSASMTTDVGGSIFAATQMASGGFQVIQPAANVTGSPTWAVATFPVPLDRATAGSINARAVWTVRDTHATSGSVSVIRVGLGYVSSSAVVRTAASVGASPAYNYTAPRTFLETSLGNLPSFGANDVVGTLWLLSDQQDSADTTGSGISFLGVKLRYVSDRTGTATGAGQ